VDAAAKRSQHADPPITHFVARAFDDDVAVIWHYCGSNFLVSQKTDEVFCRHGVQVVLAD
jgi:hypothetical protein